MSPTKIFRHCFRMRNGILIELKVQATSFDLSWTRAIARLSRLGFRIAELTHLPG